MLKEISIFFANNTINTTIIQIIVGKWIATKLFKNKIRYFIAEQQKKYQFREPSVENIENTSS